MTVDRIRERELATRLTELYVGPLPDYRDELLQRIERTPQRPAWSFPERWLPKSVVRSRVATAPPVRWRTVLVLGLLVLALVAGTILVVGAQRARLPPPFGPAANGPLLYSWHGDIITRETFAADARVLIGGDANDVAPSYSPDGTKFLFFRGGTTGQLGPVTEQELWVAAADGSKAVKVGGPYTDCCWVDWSPSGDRIAVAHTDAGVSVIDIARTDGGGSTRLDGGVPADFPTFRPPDGSQLLFRGRQIDGKGWAFYLANADGTSPRRLMLETDAGYGSDSDFLDPAWSPTGDRLAFSVIDQLPQAPGGRGERIHVAQVSPNGTVVEARRLTDEAKVDGEFAPQWLPSGDGIVHRRFDGVGEEVWLAAASGPVAPRYLGVSAGSGLPFSVSPDGRQVLALNTHDYTVYSIDLASSAVDKHFSADGAAFYQRVAAP